MRADGTVLQEPGYDPLTGIFFSPRPNFRGCQNARAEPTPSAARDALLEIVEDFPFATDAHKAAWLAALLTPLARYGFHGPAPLFLIDANVRGSGKSLLADVVSEINAGREMSRMSQPKDDDECRKRITAVAVAGETLMLMDNLDRMLGNASLDAALTATSWTDRILARQKWPAEPRCLRRGTPPATTSSWPPTRPGARCISGWKAPTRTPRSAKASIIPNCCAGYGKSAPAGRGRGHHPGRLLFQRPPKDECQAVGIV